ncbi:RDD family protein [Thermodesulfobacteriota bacterium]
MEVSACAECGKSFYQEEMIRYGDAWVCAACKPIFIQKLKEGVSVAGEMNYAGFWTRFGAKFADGIIVVFATMVISFLISIIMSSLLGPTQSFGILISLLQILVPAAYSTFFLGKYGATPGKMAAKLIVVTADGGRVSYARALGRHLGEWLSSIILLLGYIMAAFDDQKRTLHDRICNTRVIKK